MKIRKIEAEKPLLKQRKKVAAYARVSMESERLAHSLSAQVSYYSELIQGNPEWEYAGVYADSFISGTGTAKRSELQRLIANCEAGKIDIVLTKSISRFARNTVDLLEIVRHWKRLGISVRFEKESIWTFDSKGEMLLTILSSLSQEESRSISENVKWGQRKKFSDGRFSMSYSRFLGYEKGEDGTMVINEEQADIVRQIYGDFISGLSPKAIAKKLTEQGAQTPGGQAKWYEGTVRSILKNEKYAGNCLLQKYITVDFLTKKKKVNEGEAPQYFVKEHHPAIIDPETFDLVQTEIARRAETEKRYSAVSIFSSKIVCGDCGAFYGQKVWHSTDKYRKVVWRCNHKYKEHGQKGMKCSTPTLTEDEIKEAFVKAMNNYLKDKQTIIRNIETLRKALCDTTQLEEQKTAASEEMNVVVELLHRAMDENARIAQDQEEYERKYASMEERYNKAEAIFNDAEEKMQKQGARYRQLGQIIRKIKALDSPLTEFDARLWGVFVEKMTVMADGRKILRFKDGTDIEG